MRLLTWNIQWGRGADGKVDLARTVAAIRAAGDFDVICLQEVACNFPGLAGGAREDEPAYLAAAFPGYEAVFAAGMDVPDGEGGRGQSDRRAGRNGRRKHLRHHAVIGQPPGNARHLGLCGQVRSISHTALYRGLQDERQPLAHCQCRYRPDAARIGSSIRRRRGRVLDALRERNRNGHIGSRPFAGVGKRNRILQHFAFRSRIAACNAGQR